METRTIGKFIATLRKASGMTQKELAEKLNVSDKSVSRWERDEGAPDLSLIPVIAEVFGVTCDELLRGERRSPAERASEPEEPAPTAKAEKQRQRILSIGLTRFRTGSFISMGISAAGLLAAMICNLGFLRAFIGFFIGCLFYVASIVSQSIFTNTAFLSVSDEEMAGADTDLFRKSVVQLANRSLGLTLTLLGITLPLIVFPHDAYVGLSADSWLIYGLVFGSTALVLWRVIWYFLGAQLLKKGTYALPVTEEPAYWHNHRLKRTCAIVLILLLGVTGILQIAVNTRFSSWNLAEGITFTDYESFREFMAQEGNQDPYIQEPWATAPVSSPNQDTVYYDMYGNEISEEEALRTELRIPDGTPEGKVVCTYIWRNSDVIRVDHSNTEDGLPLIVITEDGLRAGQQKNDQINLLFTPLYILELAGTAIVYRKKRA